MLKTSKIDDLKCHCPTHNQHLCYLVSQGFNLSDKEEYQSLLSEPAYKCGKCKLPAHSDKNLCMPVSL